MIQLTEKLSHLERLSRRNFPLRLTLLSLSAYAIYQAGIRAGEYAYFLQH